eukprot:CAMPEP_0172791106 /NCGR_PEP_ID=MMETSP1074-20121228/208303_1 /TAXON_ID=2916 /ORGANISM="Ceratium fusus, Strain PA161109" /LENGTH=292 /DNA_ID=CAMNT_0013628161 /DNA_START=56 /DNA_END=932 /DNA_ORIENTATION=-
MTTSQLEEDVQVVAEPRCLVQHQKKARLPDKDPAACTEAVLVEPRALHYTAVALKSAVGVADIDLVTFAHGQDNAKFSHDLVEGDKNLDEAYNRGFLRLLSLPVGDLGGDRIVNKMPETALIEANSSYCARWHHEYTRLLVSPGFWNLLRCDRVLIFQSDTVFCRGSSATIEDFKAFPYIGGETPGISAGEGRMHMNGGFSLAAGHIGGETPGISAGEGRMHMNGGFSLRSRAAMLQCIENDMQDDRDLGEDEIYSRCPFLMQPPRDLADLFAIDNAQKMPSNVPLGVHKPW